jgi:glycosyltransferase involved in cell wall biosynthesis
MVKGKRILIIDFADYEEYPIGGYLSFAKSLMESFGSDLALAGITTRGDDPVGKWFKKNINGSIFDFFAMARYDKSKTRHFLPDRLVSYLLLKYFNKRIFKININNIFLQRQELLLSISKLESRNVCYCFGGLENPLAISKYKYAPYISTWFEKAFFKRLRSVNTILASGDGNAIKEMITRSKGMLSASQVIKFPTRINSNVFRPLNKEEARGKLNLSQTSTILVTTGRLAQLKGWEFMVDCFLLFNKTITDAQFYFIGEGEDQAKLKNYIYHSNLADKILLAGKKSPEEIALYLNAADLFIMGSYKEGWSTSLIEANACGVPACVTDFSSAKEIIEEGKNGFVVNEHNTSLFVQFMLKALKLTRPVQNDKIMMLSSGRLKVDLLKYWKLV